MQPRRRVHQGNLPIKDGTFTENPDSPVMASAPKFLLVSTNINANALIHPSEKVAKKTTNQNCLPNESTNNHQHTPEKSTTKEKSTNQSETSTKKQQCPPTSKEQCLPDWCIMKRSNKCTWWVQCAQCSQWYHIECAKLTKKEAQDKEFICEDCV